MRNAFFPPKGLTLFEILVLLVLLLILASLSLPAVSVGLTKSLPAHALNNMKQMQMATRQMAIDNGELGLPVGWTCSNNTPLTREQWKRAILSGHYLCESDLQKLLSVTFDRRFIGSKTIPEGFDVFAVTGTDPEDTLLFATKNWHVSKDQKLAGEPFGTSLFVVMRKGGSGSILQAEQASNVSKIGNGGVFNYLPLQ